jgi:hypothetical protein
MANTSTRKKFLNKGLTLTLKSKDALWVEDFATRLTYSARVKVVPNRETDQPLRNDGGLV